MERRSFAYTGADTFFYRITTSKPILKTKLIQHRVPTSPFVEITESTTSQEVDTIAPYPLIVKPSVSYASISITDKRFSFVARALTLLFCLVWCFAPTKSFFASRRWRMAWGVVFLWSGTWLVENSPHLWWVTRWGAWRCMMWWSGSLMRNWESTSVCWLSTATGTVMICKVETLTTLTQTVTSPSHYSPRKHTERRSRLRLLVCKSSTRASNAPERYFETRLFGLEWLRLRTVTPLWLTCYWLFFIHCAGWICAQIQWTRMLRFKFWRWMRIVACPSMGQMPRPRWEKFATPTNDSLRRRFCDCLWSPFLHLQTISWSMRCSVKANKSPHLPSLAIWGTVTLSVFFNPLNKTHTSTHTHYFPHRLN